MLARSPLDLDALNNLAWLYQSRGDQRAVALSQRARQLGPGNPSVLDTAGWIQLRLGDPRLGLSLLQQAARLAPANPDIQYHLAAALVESGQVGAGKKYWGPCCLLGWFCQSGRGRAVVPDSVMEFRARGRY